MPLRRTPISIWMNLLKLLSDGAVTFCNEYLNCDAFYKDYVLFLLISDPCAVGPDLEGCLPAPSNILSDKFFFRPIDPPNFRICFLYFSIPHECPEWWIVQTFFLLMSIPCVQTKTYGLLAWFAWRTAI